MKQLKILRDGKPSSPTMPSKGSLADRELNVDSERKANELKTIMDVLRSIEKTREREYEKTERELNVLMALSKLLPQHSVRMQENDGRNNVKESVGMATTVTITIIILLQMLSAQTTTRSGRGNLWSHNTFLIMSHLTTCRKLYLNPWKKHYSKRMRNRVKVTRFN